MENVIDVLNGAAVPWAESMWAALWQSTALAGLILAVGALFRGLPPAIRFWLWMMVGLRLLVMPFVSLEIPVIPVPEAVAVAELDRTVEIPARRGLAPGVMAAEPAGPAPLNQPATPIPAPAHLIAASGVPANTPLSFTGFLFLLWCAGFAIAIGRLGWACIPVCGIIASARFDDARVRALSARMGALFGMADPPRVGVSEIAASPFVFGVFRPVVILPARLVAKVSEEELGIVLAHEFAHVRRRDTLLGWIFAFCHALYFFHPVLFLVKRQLLFERERACDEWVLNLCAARPSAYARVLVAAASMCGASRAPAPVLVVGHSFQDLTRRIDGMRVERRFHPGVSRRMALALVIFGLLAAPGLDFTEDSVAIGESFAAALPDAAVTPTTERTARTDSGSDHSPSDTAKARVRTLRFPVDRTVGSLKFKSRHIPHYIDRYWYWNDDGEWAPVGGAQGIVEVPEDMLVWLVLNKEGFRDTSFLRDLKPDDLYRLSTIAVEEGDEGLKDRGIEDVVTLTGLRHVELRYSEVTDRGLALLPQLPMLERLETPRRMTEAGLAHIARISSLQGLYINKHQSSDAGIAEIAKLKNLRELYLSGAPFTDAGLAHLAELPNLEYLMLLGIGFGDAAMPHVARIPNLTNLNASRMPLTNRGIQALAAAPKLETLSLYGVNEITGVALSFLAEMKTLRRLGLDSPADVKTNLNSQSMRYLAASKSLEALDAPRGLNDSGLVYLAQLPNLRELNVPAGSNDADITDAGILSLAKRRSLVKFSISGGGISDAGLKAIGDMRNLENLLINTGSRSITNDGVAQLARLTQLKDLSLWFDNRSGVSIAALNRLNTLTKLEELSILGFNLDESVLDISGMESLSKAKFHIPGGLRDEDVACFASMKKLRWLQGLSGVSDSGVSLIAGMTQLDRLSIKGEGVTDRSLALLANLKALDTLYISGNFTDSGIQELQALSGLHWLELESATPLNAAAEDRLVASLPNLTLYNHVPLGAGG